MAPGESPSSVAACPSADDLRAYGLGRLPLPRLEAVAEHIDDCPACQATLRGLQDGSDTLVSQLRRLAPPKIPAEDETRTASGEQSATAVSTDSDRDEVVWAGRKRLGEYELLEPLGGGGMGLVFRARQVPLNLIVALKVIRTGDFASPAEKARFRTEGEAIARLKHPNVVQVHHFGEADGLPYFSMEFLNGGSLSRRLADEPMPARPAAELVRTLALAVQAAHYQKIVHRDLKPGNVLLAADGTPKISDFGLAKLLDADSGQTATSAAIGTPTYMAPEQARADGSDVGFAVDIYALGVILYQALVGHPPFRGATPAATMELVKTQPVPPPTQEQPALSRDLEAVCLKCLEKDPAKRYASARDLADDLDNWLDLRPTRARPRNRLDRTLLAMRRRPRLTALAAACLLAGVATATALHYTDRDRPLRDIEARLARGETVTLIGETGGPRWSEWRLGGETGKAWVADDQSFRVESWSICLLDLVRGPGPARYRLRAEVWHRDSSHSGQVGFYVGHREDPSPAGAFHRFARFYFNEIIDDKAKHAELIDKFPNLPPAANGLNPPPQPTGNSVFLDYRLFRDGDWNTGWDQKIDGRSAELIAPVGYGGSWRPLTIDVSPERISARWGAGERVGELSSADLTANGRQSLLRMRKQRPGDHTFENLDLKFSASGSLGLYVNNSSASFRNVIVEPLAEDD